MRQSYRSGRSWRPICRTSRKPAVTISAVEAPLRSSSVFVATVVPCMKKPISLAGTPSLSTSISIPVVTPSAWFAGVDGVFVTSISFVSTS